MPKQTFFNLNADKRKRIEDAATKEFAEYGFHGARLNNIVQNAGIAKGSFYQYFEDLDDLFLHLIKTHIVLKLNAIQELLDQNNDADLFTKFAKIQKTGMLYLVLNVQLNLFGIEQLTVLYIAVLKPYLY